MAGGESTRGIEARQDDLIAMAIAAQGGFPDFELVAFCDQGGHSYPAAAGVCPQHAVDPQTGLVLPSSVNAPIIMIPSVVEVRRSLMAASVPSVVNLWLDLAVDFIDNGLAPRHRHAFGHETDKRVMVHHIPVCTTLQQLINYLNGGNALGSYYVGVGRGFHVMLVWGNARIPVSRSVQFMAILGMQSPWAQGITNCAGSCRIQCHPRVHGWRSGEANGDALSVSYVDAGQPLPDDEQFNASVFWRAWWSSYFSHEISPDTQLWHSEIDRVNRCGDPPWSGDVEDEMQAAAIKLVQGDISGLRAVTFVDDPQPPVPVSLEEEVARLKYYVYESHHPWLEKQLHPTVYDSHNPRIASLEATVEFQRQNLIDEARERIELAHRVEALEARQRSLVTPPERSEEGE